MAFYVNRLSLLVSSLPKRYDMTCDGHDMSNSAVD